MNLVKQWKLLTRKLSISVAILSPYSPLQMLHNVLRHLILTLVVIPFVVVLVHKVKDLMVVAFADVLIVEVLDKMTGKVLLMRGKPQEGMYSLVSDAFS
ncbi:uncharacterized protein LOC129316034 isoform X2 [Prosopis cineraria]|uniref:uncharacterized protein LOC129316034 isoform X2 n=1 Tax=Prosopis cineraria TaxID=364024 RepID=UPI00240F9010|nr:uncharacterized protein LOC129316034 isoform X2 [Prosopis cineraria]